ncbi:alkaline phosphatase [Sinomicrobium pectinilyticum]|uniref:Alkaline phosphatase n=1 Tax=Sinomicrobium pectinilyticum TaxID=1084421 RepID=A0A3N0E350_SINP1|nr:alkaline phosphatase [Sinomicrobium pectinilyticum]RNL82274.1 alkaline phosphatase [Sinomicrobium pectinilyticum]
MRFLFKTVLITVLFTIAIGCAPEKARENAGDTSAIVPEEPLSIIFMIGDGMGLSQVSSAFYFKDTVSNFERFSIIGLSKTSSTSHRITDSAAGATAFSTGEKTYKKAIGVSKDTIALPTILEELKTEGYNTGLISLTSITHATPAAFYAHVENRDMHEAIAMDMMKENVDFFAGAGLKYFTKREDGRNLYAELQAKDYHMDSTSIATVDPSRRNGFLLASEGLPSKVQGRGDFLPEVTGIALEYFENANKPFFLMVEGSYIDWGGHAKDPEMMVQEVLDFDKTLGIALDYVEKHPNTLLVVTADHETGGAAIGKFYDTDPKTGKPVENPQKVAVYFITDQHTGTHVPVFARGKGKELFSGIYENNEIYHKMRQALDME